MKRQLGTCFGCGVIAAAMCCLNAHAQGKRPATPEPLDPTRAATPVIESTIHTPLPEQYIWTVGPPQKESEQPAPRYFRRTFQAASVPSAATLYVAGPRSIKVWLNGQLADSVTSDPFSPLGIHVFITPIAKFLHPGENTIAIEAIRGRGVAHSADSPLVQQLTSGRVLAAKIVPAAPGVNVPALTISDPSWKGSTTATEGWQQPAFDDANWPHAQSFGGIESSIDLFQWNADAGMYNWPGYDGISPFLAHMKVPASAILETYTGRGAFTDAAALTGGAGEFGVRLPAAVLTNAEAPSLLLDFSRELSGRIEIANDSDTPAIVTIQMGESEPETLKSPYLGVNQLTIPAHGIGYGPKSAFRYAKLRFVGGGPELRFKTIRVDDIFYPVNYAGSFESSDPMLNRIWETGAYTAHLCMQDDIWDAPKRDRGRWMGDTDVSGRVIEAVFGDRPLMEDTLDRLMGAAPVNRHVNGIPGYSSFWFTGVANYYRHTGSRAFLEREHQRMLQLLHYVDSDFDSRGIFDDRSHAWPFVDWSPDLSGDTPETRRATTIEFYRAYRDAAWLLRELGDTANADKYDARAAATKAAAEQYLLDPATGTFGLRWQTNAAAVIGGLAGPDQYSAIWDHVLSHVGHVKFNALTITPYYNYYVIRAMADVGHRQAALDWIRTYWGGMLNEGATSFWEAYDPEWPKGNFHASLQADGSSGYFVSLAHGWSAGPTAWLMEQVLGIQPTGPGFSTTSIRPDLVDLAWAKGSEPTPHGLLKVDAQREGAGVAIAVDIPDGVVAHVSVPVTSPGQHVLVNGTAQKATPAEGGKRMVVTLASAGHYTLSAQ